MTSIISTKSVLARPSTVISRSMTDLERIALGTGGVALCLDPREIAPEYSRLTLRDRIGARPCQFSTGKIGTINGKPAVDLDGTSGLAGRISFEQPQQGYFVAAVINIRAPLGSTEAILSHVGVNDNRMFFGVMTSGALRLDHGISAAVEMAGAVTAGTAHVVWATYDPLAGRGSVGVNAVAAGANGNMATGPKATQDFNVFGGATTWSVNGLCGPLIVVDRPLYGDQNYTYREALLGWLAEYGGVALGV